MQDGINVKNIEEEVKDTQTSSKDDYKEESVTEVEVYKSDL